MSCSLAQLWTPLDTQASAWMKMVLFYVYMCVCVCEEYNVIINVLGIYFLDPGKCCVLALFDELQCYRNVHYYCYIICLQ